MIIDNNILRNVFTKIYAENSILFA